MTESNPVSNQTVLAGTVVLSVLLTATMLVQVAVLRELRGTRKSELSEIRESTGTTAARVTEMQETIIDTAARVTELEAKTPGFPAKWQYDVVSIGDLEWDSKAQELGAEGWEIIASRRASDAYDSFNYECIVKRPLAGHPGPVPSERPEAELQEPTSEPAKPAPKTTSKKQRPVEPDLKDPFEAEDPVDKYLNDSAE